MDSSNAPPSCTRYTAAEKSHPRSVTLVKDKNRGFGFTLRHFIVYPPTRYNSEKNKSKISEDAAISAEEWRAVYKNNPMETIFIREVKENTPAYFAGLNHGDRIIAINNISLSGKSYEDIIHLIVKSGSTLRLLVVPKEDDILQLYFESSAYEPVQRENNKRRYLVSSCQFDSEHSNKLFSQSSYGTYPGRAHRKINSPFDTIADHTRAAKRAFLEHRTVIEDLPPPPPFPGSYDLSSPSKGLYEGGCFSEDEELYHHAKELEESDLKGDVANLYYNLCREQDSSNFAFSSEENLNYPICMSDFNDIVHCDNSMSEPRCPDASLRGQQVSRPGPPSYQYHLSHSGNPSCDSRSTMYASDDFGVPRATVQGEPSPGDGPGMYFGDGSGNDYDYRENPGVPSINVVAQRRHHIESGNLLAESMERMHLYKSELSRMSKPNHTRLVSSRTAEFESKSSSCGTAPNQKLPGASEGSSDGRLKHAYSGEVNSAGLRRASASDRENRNKTSSDDAFFVRDADESDCRVSTDYSSEVAGVVHRRKTVPVSSESDECHIVRRISYLRATANERMNVESDLSEEDETSDASSPNKEIRIQKLKSFFGEKTPKVKQALVPIDSADVNGSKEPATDGPKSVYGWVICKVVSLEGKRSSDRSWRHLWAILRDNILYLLKDRREPSKGIVTGDEHVINVKYSIAKAANDYVKRKHVLRLLLLTGTEYLVQTESQASMMEWLNALQIFGREISELPEWLKNTSVLEKAAAYEQQIQKGKHSGPHGRKLVFRHRGPTQSSPAVKTRRASQGDELALTKIGVLWRDRMVQGWKKVHGTNSHIPKGASFGVKLENVPPGVTNEHIPLVVELCVRIVESRGLESVGVYRVPGNSASVSLLSDLVNQGVDDELLKDARWNDVNVVSSLLKAFFRKLPEPLLTAHLYPKFIQACEAGDPVKRLKAIKHVLYHLPVHNFATLRYLMYHLKKVSEHSATNKMDARNVAIVFGPTLVRTSTNNMVAMVTDMPQQCYLIETLITYAEWLFEDCGDILPLEISSQDKRKTHPPSNVQSNALLSNINKLDDESLPHEMFASLCNAASRHLRHRPKKKDPASYSKKRSGIIADDTDLLANPGGLSSGFGDPPTEPGAPESETLSDISFESCSSSRQRTPQNGGSREEEGDEPVGHRYNAMSALAQQKIRNFERETKALLRRDGGPQRGTRPSLGSAPPQVEWERIEKEWQKAKMELEQEDLLDYLADDPSYLSCLLSRGRGNEDSAADNSFQGNSGMSLSSSFSTPRDFGPNHKSIHFPISSQSNAAPTNRSPALRASSRSEFLLGPSPTGSSPSDGRRSAAEDLFRDPSKCSPDSRNGIRTHSAEKGPLGPPQDPNLPAAPS